MLFKDLTFNIDFELAAFVYLTVLLVYQYVQYDSSSRINTTFRHLLLVTLLTDAFDVLSAISISYGDVIPIWANTLINTFYFIANNVVGLYFAYYFDLCANPKQKGLSKISKATHALSFAYLFILLLNISSGFIFYFDEAGNYTHGPLYLLCFIVPLLYVLTSAYIVFSKFRRFNLKQRISLCIYFFFGIMGTFVQLLILPNVLLAVFSLSIGVVMIFFTMETNDYQDLVTTLAQLQTTQAEAEEARSTAENANQAKSLFLANMSHEIRTPINAIIGLNEMILRESKEPAVKQYSYKVQDASDALLSVINDILDISKIESGKMTVVPVEYQLGDLVDSLMSMMSIKAQEKGLQLRLTLDESLPGTLYGDDIRLKQVIGNLLSNAIKYTHEGSVDFIVAGTVSHDSLILKIAVKDTGIGIKPEDMGRLFNNYERFEERANHGIQGTGLGLSITAHLLRLMGSTLNVSSKFGEGSIFEFDVTQEIVNSKPVGFPKSSSSKLAESYNYQESFTAPNAKVLAVDDTELNLMVLKSLLKQTGIQIDTASSGAECLEMVKDTHYDIIFMDHMMPGMDGIETLERLKAMDNCPCANTPVIILTANAVAGMKEMFISKGFDNFLSKPIDFSKLEKMICQYLPESLMEITTIKPPTKEIIATDSAVPQDFDNLPDIDGINWLYAKAYNPDYELLMTSVKSLNSTLGKDADNIELLLSKLDDDDSINSLRIAAHTVKSTTAMIGASQVSGLAKTVEFAAKDLDKETIKGVTPSLTRLMRELQSNLKALLGNNSSNKVSIEDTSHIKELLTNLDNAGVDMDLDTLDSIMEELNNYSFPENLSSYIEKLQAAVTDLDSDSIHNITVSIADNL